MPDWQTYVRRHLGPLRCAPEREIEIVEEVALQLEQIYRRARSSGASEAEARTEAEAEVTDWEGLRGSLVPARSHRAHQP